MQCHTKYFLRDYIAQGGVPATCVALALRTPGWGFQTVRGGIDRGVTIFVPGLLELMYGRISDPRMDPYPPRVALALRTTPRLRFPHRAGRYRPGGPPFSSPIRPSCRGMEGYLIRGWRLIFPWCGRNAPLIGRALGPPRAPSANGIGAQKTL